VANASKCWSGIVAGHHRSQWSSKRPLNPAFRTIRCG
jgi:hypothetical protein